MLIPSRNLGDKHIIRGGLKMSEQLKILEMIEKGQITAAEGMELLEALNMTNEPESVKAIDVMHQTAKPIYKYLKIKVTLIIRW